MGRRGVKVWNLLLGVLLATAAVLVVGSVVLVALVWVAWGVLGDMAAVFMEEYR